MFIHDARDRFIAACVDRRQRHEAPGTYRPSRLVAVRRSRSHDQNTSRALRPLVPPLR
jgi:hypothetical protein